MIPPGYYLAPIPAPEAERPVRRNPPRVKQPDTFTGRDPSKMRKFLTECAINFDNDPASFDDDRARVNFASSFLDDVALDWWQPYLLQAPEHAIRSDWSLFVQELNLYCGDRNLAETASAKIWSMTMHDRHQVSMHLVDFRKWAGHTQYCDATLRDAFYRGLPERLKLLLTQTGKPATFEGMAMQALELDHYFWQHEAELGRRPGIPRSDTRATTSKTPNPPALPPPVRQIPASAGPITPAEHTRRRESNLCLWCGQAGHIRSNCTANPPPPPRPNPAGFGSSTPAQPKIGRATFSITGEEGLETTTEMDELPGDVYGDDAPQEEEPGNEE